VRRRREFPLAVGSASAARRFVVDTLTRTAAASTDLVEDVGVIVSELATNCIRHARTGFVVTVDGSRDALRVEVTDSGAGVPALRSPGPREPSGRGLQLVQAMSDEWGSAPGPRGGKTVWFTVSFDNPGQGTTGFALGG
jgi:anti-sigma regulatory factor (Ser/Thr protein kinase)